MSMLYESQWGPMLLWTPLTLTGWTKTVETFKIFFHVQQKKESHSLERIDGEKVTEFSFLGELSLNSFCYG